VEPTEVAVGIRKILPLAVGILCLAGLYGLHLRLDNLKASIPKAQRFMALPQGDFLRVLSLGYRQVVADLLWLQTVQMMGEKTVSKESGRWIFHALDVATTLDPKFVVAYEAGGIALCTMVVLPDASNALLEKGMRNNPEEWKLPFMLGINYYFEFQDDAKAAHYIAQASRLPGAPEYLARLAARLYASAREPQTAIDLLAQVYEHTTDDNVKRVLEQRVKELVVERDIQIMEVALGSYVQQHNKRAEGLEDLVAAGLLPAIPTEPFGGAYLYDRTTQSIRSSMAKTSPKPLGRRRAL
jgi:hypothetical protein